VYLILFRAAISVGPILPFLYSTGQVWTEAVLGRFVRALRSVLGTCLGGLWDYMKVVAR